MARVIEATLRLIDGFTPILRNVDEAISQTEGALRHASESVRNYGHSMQEQSQHIIEARRQNMRLARSLHKTGDRLVEIGQKGALAVAPLAGAMAMGLKSAADLDTKIAQMTLLIDGANSSTMPMLRNNIMAISDQTGISRDQVADMTEELLSQDVPLQQIKTVGMEIAQTARIGGSNLQETTGTALKLLTIYHMTYDQIGQIGDKLITTKNVSSATLEDLAQYGALVANATQPLNVNYDLMLATFGAVRDIMPTAEKTDTVIRGVATALSSLSNQQNQLLLQHGVNVRQLLDQGKSMVDIIGIINNATKGMTAAQRQSFLYQVLGNQEAVQGFTAIAQQQEKIKSNYEQIANSQGQLNKEVNKLNQQDVIKYQLAKNRLSNAWVTICARLEPLLSAIASCITDAADALGHLSAGQLKAIGSGIALLAGLSAMSMATGFLTKGVGGLLGGLTKLAINAHNAGGVMALMAGKGADLKKGLQEIGVAGSFLSKMTLANFMDSMAGATAKAGGLWASMRRFLSIKSWGGIFKGMGRSAASGFRALGTAAISGVKGSVKTAISLFKGIPNALKNLFSLNTLKSIFSVGKNIVRTGIGSIFKIIRLGFSGIGLLFSPVGLAIVALIGVIYLLVTHWQQVKTAVMPIIKILINTIDNAFHIMQKPIQNLIAAFKKLVQAWQKTASNPAVKQVIGYLKMFAMILGGVVLGAIIAFVGAAVGALSGFLTMVAHIIATAIDIFANLISFVTNVLTGNWSGAWQNIVNIFKDIFSGLKQIASDVINSVVDTINGGISAINGAISAVTGGKVSIPTIPHFAGGVDDFGGGLARINEEGGEIVNLPSHTQVIPHDESLKMEYERGKRAGGGNITIAKLADSIIVRQESDIDKLATALANKISLTAMNRMEGALA